MLGDILLITEKHYSAAEQIIAHILNHRIAKMIVAVSGESGSGKSELSHAIAKGLRKHGIFAKLLHTDNYYRVLPLERTEWRKKNGIENVVGPNEYDWNTLNRNIEEFQKGLLSTGPCVDLVTEQVDLLTTDYQSIEMLVVDGLYAIKVAGASIRVFIELTYHETKKAQVSRGKEPQNEYRWTVLEKEHQEVQKLKMRANVLINKEYQVRFLNQ